MATAEHAAVREDPFVSIETAVEEAQRKLKKGMKEMTVEALARTVALDILPLLVDTVRAERAQYQDYLQFRGEAIELLQEHEEDIKMLSVGIAEPQLGAEEIELFRKNALGLKTIAEQALEGKVPNAATPEGAAMLQSLIADAEKALAVCSELEAELEETDDDEDESDEPT